MEPPIVCTLDSETLRARREGLLSDLVRRAEQINESADGVIIRFAPAADILLTISQAIEAERHCCPFLRFTVNVEPYGGPITLQLSGPTGTREFLAALLA